MSQAYLPAVRRRLLGDPSGAYAPPDDESILNSPPTGMGGPYSPPVSASRPDVAPTLNGGAYAPAVPSTAPTVGGAYQPQPNYTRDVLQPEAEGARGRLESAYSAPHSGTLRQVFGALVGSRNPALGGIISGETGRNRNIENAEREYSLIANAIATNRAMQTADITNRKNVADTGKLDAETAAIPAKAALENAQAEAANYKEDPNLGLIDLRTKQPVNQNALAPLSKEEAEVLGKQEGERVPLKLKNTASEILNRGFATINTEEGVYERNRGTGSMTRLGSNPRMMFAPGERYIPAAMDPANPGVITIVKAKDAAAAGAQAPSSAAPAAAKATLKSAASGDIAKQSTAFQTAMQHADLLEQATKALGNGDERTLNTLKNKFQTEFGSADVTNWQAISNAYTREITAMLSKGHITNAEIESAGGTLPANASPQQILGAIHTYKALANSKMNILKQQTERGTQGKANFPTDASGGLTAADMLKKYPPKH